MKRKFLFSILVPCYNSEEYVEKCLRSILNQTYKNIQLIVINDGSQDNTDEIIKRMGKKFKKSKIEFVHLKKENGGVSSAINMGLPHITGDYFVLVDSDDYVADCFIETFNTYFKEHPEIKVLRYNGQMIPEEKEHLIGKEKFRAFQSSVTDFGVRNRFYNALLEEDIGALGVSTVYNTKAFDIVVKDRQIYNSKGGQNFQLILPMSYRYNIGFIRKPIYCCIKRSDSLSSIQFDSLEKKYNQIDGHEDIIINTLKSIDMPEDELEYCIELIHQKYNKVRHSAASKMGDELNRIKYKKLSEENGKLYKKKLKELAHVDSKIKPKKKKAKSFVKRIARRLAKPLLRKLKNIDKDLASIKKRFERIESKLEKSQAKLKKMNGEIKESKLLIDKQNELIKDLEDNEIGRLENLFYDHSGSGNHGCEALIRTIPEICEMNKNISGVYSSEPEEDRRFGIHEKLGVIRKSSLQPNDIPDLLFDSRTIALSIGEDNYCDSDETKKKLAMYNYKFNSINVKTALIGCSIEPRALSFPDVMNDLNQYSLITARESITYNALIESGINSNTHLIPDSAFILDKIDLPLPRKYKKGKTIGINAGGLVISETKDSDNVFLNYKKLIEYIIENTDYNIMLVPHVMQDSNSDKQTLENLYLSSPDKSRIELLPEYGAREIKGFISRCEIFIGARTHSTIAAYSTCVPTLAVGDSIKAKGIAKDIFGTHEDYVVPIEAFKNDDELITAFIWLEKNSKEIKKYLQDFIPDYKKQCYKLKALVEAVRMNGVRKALPVENLCTGCSACEKSCSIGAIEMQTDYNGFQVPGTDYNKCVNCDKCRDICPVNGIKENKRPIKVIGAKNKDSDIVRSSSSGGLFHSLAAEVMSNKKGIVYGAAFENGAVRHIRINKLADLPKLQRSKYVQSDINNTFNHVKEDLDNAHFVLFVGTPCQVAGLKAFLGKEYGDLFTIDFICHGVPSPKVFDLYKKHLEKKFESSMIDINFRDKPNGWKKFHINATFKNGNIYNIVATKDPYFKSFLKNTSLRNCCYNCHFKNGNYKSDITLADFWKIETVNKKFNDDKGVSSVLVNTSMGLDFIQDIEDEISIFETDYDTIYKTNSPLYKSVKRPSGRDVLFQNIDQMDIIEAFKRT